MPFVVRPRVSVSLVVLLLLMMVLEQVPGVMAPGLQPLQTQTLQGILEYEFGDGADQTIAFAHYFLYAGGETRVELLFDTPPWYGYLGRQVVVQGTVVTGQAVTAQVGVESTVWVSSISLASGNAVASMRAVTGTRSVILLLVRFYGDSQEPHPPSWYTNIFNPSTGNTVNSYYLANSWGQLGWTATATNWMALPHNKTYYAPHNDYSHLDAKLGYLFNDAVALGVAAGVNFALYDNIAIVTNNDLDCCAAGGAVTYNGKIYGVVWEPPWSAQVATFAHELGHSIGLPHSGWEYYDYDSPWDVMSQSKLYNDTACGSYASANLGGTRTIYCYTPADIIAPYKDMVGWIDESHLMTVPAEGLAAGVSVDSLAAPLSGSMKMIKICTASHDCTSGGATAIYYTVEVRTRYGFDSYLGIPHGSALSPANLGGVIIHMYDYTHSGFQGGRCFFINQAGPAYPVDNFNVVPPPHYDTQHCSDNISGRLRGLYYANYDVGQFVNLGVSTTIGVVSRSTAGGVTTYLVDVNMPPNSRYSATFQQTGIQGMWWGVTVAGTRYRAFSNNVITLYNLLGSVSYQYDSSVLVGVSGSYVCTLGCSGSVSGPGTVTATYTYQTIIIARNRTPKISSLTADKASPRKVGSTITWTCRASDPDNDAIEYTFQIQVGGSFGRWVTVQNWSKFNVWSWTPSIPGTYNVRCLVRDNKHLSINNFDDSKIVYGYRIT